MIEKIISLKKMAQGRPQLKLPNFPYPSSHPLVIDIETTGFSPKNSMIYAIGCIYQKNQEFYFHQLFAEHLWEEDAMLIALEAIIQTHQIDLLVHFNGQNFDIPFLKGRYLNAQLFTSLGQLNQLDFYLQWKKCRPYFDLPNAKLKSLEKTVNLDRKDQMHGGQLILVYERYLQGQVDLLPLLLLHNQEDLLATFLLGHFLPFLEKKTLAHHLLPYFDAFPHIEKTGNDREIIFYNPGWRQYLDDKFNSSYFSPQMKSTYIQKYRLIHDQMYHFFPDYQNYIYLPQEDTAIHQSIAQFVEPAYRQKARKRTAYIKKRDSFIELPLSALAYFTGTRLFQRSYQDKNRYLPLDQADAYFNSLTGPHKS